MYFTEIPADWFHLLRGRGHGDWWWGQLEEKRKEEKKKKVDSLHYPDILFWLGLLAPLKETGPSWTARYIVLLLFLLHSSVFAPCFQVSVSWKSQALLTAPSAGTALFLAASGKSWKLFAKGERAEIDTGLRRLSEAWLTGGIVTEEGGRNLWQKLRFPVSGEKSVLSAQGLLK